VANSESISTRTIYTTASRGCIYDRYGRILAGNKQTFNIRLSVDGQTNDQLNTSITALLKVLKKNNDSYVDDFPIKITAGGKYYYTYDRQITKWLKKKGLSNGSDCKRSI